MLGLAISGKANGSERWPSLRLLQVFGLIFATVNPWQSYETFHRVTSSTMNDSQYKFDTINF